MATKIICTTAKCIKRLGGAAAMQVARDTPEAIPEVVAQGAKPGDDIVVFHESLRDILSPEQLAAILAHELGHVELGHTRVDYAAMSLFGKKQLEFAADRHAVSLGHSASTLIAAVGILTELSIREFFSDDPDCEETREAIAQCREAVAPINQERATALGL
jgi:Zn-dependent protease with chaperone function